jgi:bisphosphoglycerate-dependent phosphoglycerate mutase
LNIFKKQYLFPTETVQSGSDRIPQKIVDQTKLFQKSHEHTIKAIELEQRFKTHLELVQTNKDDLNQLYGESMSMYQRSMVPFYERPVQKQMKHSSTTLCEQVSY